MRAIAANAAVFSRFFLARSFSNVAEQLLVCCSAAVGNTDFRLAEKRTLQYSFSFVAAQLLVTMTSALQPSECCSAVSAAQPPENCRATSVCRFCPKVRSAVAICEGWTWPQSPPTLLCALAIAIAIAAGAIAQSLLSFEVTL